MLKCLGELEIRKSAYYQNTVIKALENAGLVIILSSETSTEGRYIIADGPISQESEDKE